MKSEKGFSGVCGAFFYETKSGIFFIFYTKKIFEKKRFLRKKNLVCVKFFWKMGYKGKSSA